MAGSDVASRFAQAVHLHETQRLGEAEALYRHVIAIQPNHAGAIARLGLLALQVGQAGPALELIEQSLLLSPGAPDALNFRGQALKALGQHEAAAASFRAALRARPGAFDLLYNLGNTLRDAGSLEDAATAMRRAIKRRPDFADAHNNLGNILRQLGRLEEAAACFRRAIALSPQAAPLHFNLGAVLDEADKPGEAADSFRAATGLASQMAEAHHRLGQALARAGLAEEALAALGEALLHGGAQAAVHTDMAYALNGLDRRLEAVEHLRQAVAAAPLDPQAHTHLGTLLRDLGDDAGAVASLHRALALRPDFSPARYNLSVTHLLAGRLEQGWPLYEARLPALAQMDGRFRVPLWRGELMPGETLLLHAEQGLGDTLQFCRYVTMAASASRATVVLEVQRPLLTLLAGFAAPGITVMAAGDPLPRFDRHCPLPSLPLAFATTLASIPAHNPYLRADPVQVERWRGRLSGISGLKVGLVWAGNPGYEHDALRSLPQAALAALHGVHGVTFVSLQIERGRGTDGQPACPIEIDWTADLHDVAATAALMCALDLVISADTAMVHLAGALGRPVWLLNRRDTDWRWLRNRTEDSPWYPTLRQFRGTGRSQWQDVLASVRDALVHQTPGIR